MSSYTQITKPSDVEPFMGRVVHIKYELNDNGNSVIRYVFGTVNHVCELREGMTFGPSVITYQKPGEVNYISSLAEDSYKYHRKWLRPAESGEIEELKAKLESGELVSSKGGFVGLQPRTYCTREQYLGDGVKALFRPFQMTPEFVYSEAYLTELEAAKQERRLPTGDVFCHIFKRLVKTDIIDYFIEKSLPKLETDWGGLKHSDPRPELDVDESYAVLSSSDFQKHFESRDTIATVIALNKMMAMFFNGVEIEY